MLVIMKVSMQGPQVGLTPGDEPEFDAKQAIALIDAQFAVAKDPEEEAAVRAELGLVEAEAGTDPEADAAAAAEAAAKAEADAAAAAEAEAAAKADAAAPAPAKKKR